ncbi:MAG TPA: phosphotransferase [Tepidisphaeraceae bacterium]|nr:phosphotransferase [Tepidisphaeraceae bacterium]
MAEIYEWDRGLLSTDTVVFDRALLQLRRNVRGLSDNPPLIRDLAAQIKKQPGITRREFDRRFRLIVSEIVRDDSTSTALQAIASHLRDSLPEALNAIRTLLPAELRHVAVQTRSGPQSSIATPPAVMSLAKFEAEPVSTDAGSQVSSRFSAVALIGTPEEHVRNESLLKSANLAPLRLPSLEHLWNIAPTGLCGFVVGASAWGQVAESDQRRSIRRICEYSTFLFVRVCVDGLSPAIAQTFSQDAAEARCGLLDGQKFCHGQDGDLTLADIGVLQSIARLLEAAGTADFFPLGLSELDASLLRLIAADRRHPGNPLTIRRLGTRELEGGRSGARVFLLNDGSAQPFVAKVGDAEQLTSELRRYRRWIQNWEPSVTTPTFHAHLGSAAVSYRLQSAPDGNGTPAPTLEDCLEKLRSCEWVNPIETSTQLANDLFQAVSRAIDRLTTLNSLSNDGATADEFWLHWPIRDLASRGIDSTILDHDWQPIMLWSLVQDAMSRLQPDLARGLVHGDIHGRNILLLDRLPAFIDFAWSGPGHPLVDLVRLDAVVRSVAMRMVLDERTMHDIFRAIYIDGTGAETILGQHAAIAVSPLAALAVRTAAKIREAALIVASAHSLGLPDFLAMTCVVSAHVLVTRSPGSGIERLILSVVGAAFLADRA